MNKIDIDTLARGSANLNKMREEIKLWLHLLEKFFALPQGKITSHYFRDDRSGTCWKVFTDPSGGRPNFLIFCEIPQLGDFHGNIPLDGIKRAHDALNGFIEGILAEYPDLEHRLRTFTGAA